MKGTGGTNGTGPGPEPSGPISTKEAAAYFGITERAVRKRIHAGTLMGEQIAGQWVVYPQAVRQGRPSRNPAQDRRAEELGNRAAGSPVPPTQGPPQLTAIMQEWLAPLIHENGDLREQLGRERTLRTQAEARITELEQYLVVPPTTEAHTAQPMPTATTTHPGNARSRVLRWLADQLA